MLAGGENPIKQPPLLMKLYLTDSSTNVYESSNVLEFHSGYVKSYLHTSLLTLGLFLFAKYSRTIKSILSSGKRVDFSGFEHWAHLG